MRDEILYAVAAFADEGFHRKVWLEGFAPSQPYAYDFEMACHALLDDVDLTDDPDRLVGIILKDEHEVAILRRLATALLNLIEDIGVCGNFAEALESSKWPTVVTGAKDALVVLGGPDRFP